MEVICALVGALAGGALVFLLLRTRTSPAEAKLGEDLQQVRIDKAGLEAELKQRMISFEEQKAMLLEAETRFSDAFKNLSQTALSQTSESFLQLATQNFEKHQEGATGDLRLRQRAIEELVKPLKDTLEKMDKQTQEIEQKRLSAYESVTEHIGRLMQETTDRKSTRLNSSH